MNYRLISKESSFCSMMYRISKEEGSDCLTFIEDKPAKRAYDGLLNKVDSPIELNPGLRDIIIFDSVGAGKEAEVLKSKGYYVIGGGKINDEIELDRKLGGEFMNRHGIRTPESYTFYDFKTLEEFVRKQPDRYVFKPSGNLGTSLTYLSTSPENMIGMLPFLNEQTRAKDCKEFTLQQYLEGITMSTEAWFNGQKFLLPLNSTFEEKRLMDGGRGPQTGCMGSVVWNWDMDTSRMLYNLLFKDMEEELGTSGYVGPLDINCIWTDSGPYGLEFTARFGYDAVQNFARLLSIPFGEFLTGLRGTNEIPIKNPYAIALSVAVSSPPYPHEMPDIPKVPILGISEEDIQDTVYLSDAAQDGPGSYRTTGCDNWALSVIDDGVSIDGLRDKVYKKVESIELPDKQYRGDIGERYVRDKRKVWKYIMNTFI